MTAELHIEQVTIEDTAPPGHAEAVREAFAAAGFEVEVESNYLRKSFDALPWVVMVVVSTPVVSFFQAFGSAAGTDAYGAVKAWLKEVRSARAGAGTGEGSVRITDPENTNVILSSSLPEEAIDALRSLDWDEHRGDYLIWDGARGVWLDPTKRDQ